MDIRALDRRTHRSQVVELFSVASDYVMLEKGHPPNASTVDAFFDDRPPNVARQDALHMGMFDGDKLRGLTTMAFGYPGETDAYIGLLLLVPAARGLGHGARILSHLTVFARARGADRQLVAVLDANAKGRLFWEREGFMLQKTFRPTQDGHVRHRLTRAI